MYKAQIWFNAAIGLVICATAVEAADPRSQPLGPRASLAAFELHPDLRIELVASEPEVVDPISLCFDDRGRMWVVEMRDYPTGPIDGGSPNGKIKILEDRDGDGYCETSRVFADGLAMPTGLTCFRDGVIATVAGKVMYLGDRDDDGVCDVQEVWFEGFSEGNEQLRANHPTWTLENRIHVASGLRGGDVRSVHTNWPAKSEPLSLAARDFEFSPFGGDYRAVAGNSQYGFFQDSGGRRYVCENRHPCRLVLATPEQAAANPLLPPADWIVDVMPAAENSQVFPLVDAWTTSNLHQGTFTAACGVFRYQSDLLTNLLSDDFFACEPTGSLVQRYRTIGGEDSIVPNTERGREGIEFLASRDPWFRPVDLTDGPEGAIYITDMHRAVIEHPEWVPTELKHRVDERYGDKAGRIYRIVPKDWSPSPITRDLYKQTSQKLTGYLAHPNRWTRNTAQRLLAEMLGEQTFESQAAGLADTVTPRFRFEWLLEFAAEVSSNNVMILTGIYDQSSNDSDSDKRWIANAFGLVNPSVSAEFVRHAIEKSARNPDLDLQLLKPLVKRMAWQDPVVLWETLLTVKAPPTESLWPAALAGLALKQQTMGNFADRLTATARDQWRLIFENAMRDSLDTKQPPLDRLRALQFLAADAGPAAIERCQTLVDDPEEAVWLRAVEIIAAGAAGDQSAAWVEQLVARIPSCTPGASTSLVQTIVRNSSWSVKLVDALESGDVPRTFVDPISMQQLARHPDTATRERVAKLINTSSTIDPATIGQYTDALQGVLDGASDVALGQTLFRRHCISCHRIENEGFVVGPDVSDLRTQTPGQILQSILDPSAAVDANYFRYSLLTVDGRVLEGLLIDQNVSNVTLQAQNEVRHVVPRAEIEALKASGLSMMPVGFAEQMNPTEMAAVIAYLKLWRLQ